MDRDPPTENTANPPGPSQNNGRPSTRRWWRRQVLYPNLYVWLVFLASLDLMLTWVILHLGGAEVNVLADAVIRRAGVTGASAFKFALIVFVIGVCEVAGRHHERTGRRLAEWAVAVTAVPVALGLIQLVANLLRGGRS